MESEAREKLAERLKPEEGLRLQAYDDASGKVIRPGEWIHVSQIPPVAPQVPRIGWVTAGYGRNLVGRGITNTEAALFLKADITDVVLELDRLVPWWTTLDASRQIVIADMAYNMGASNFVNGWPTFFENLKAGYYEACARIMDGSKWKLRDVSRKRSDPLIGMMRDGKFRAYT